MSPVPNPAVAPLLVTSEAFETLEPEWAALHAAIPEATVFFHPAWYATWLRHFGANVQPVFLSLRDGEELVGVAALEIDTAGARQLGDHNVTDYSGPLVRPGFEQAAASAIVEWLLEDLTSSVTFWGIAADSPMRAALGAAADQFGWACEETHEAVCPRVELPADFETYLGGLSKHGRHELRRKMRNLDAAGEIGFETYTSEAEVVSRLDRFLELMRISREDKETFLTPEMEGYFRDVAGTFSRLGMLRLAELTVDDHDAAMILCFENASTLSLYNSGYDPEFAPLAVGLVSKAMALQDAIGRGKRVFDFLRGEEDYKKRLGGVPREVLTVKLTGR